MELTDEQLRRELLNTTLFAHAPQEAEDYVSDSLLRFQATLAFMPELAAGARVLELGSNPYFLTRLLQGRGLELTCANYFGDAVAYSDRGEQVVRSGEGGEEVIAFDHFNVERDRFPYSDGSFDLVLCCELLEHLPNDPVQMLAEIHRVLRQPHGALLLTTPNASRLENLLRSERGENVYEPLSGYGTYGRHNREYTVDELRLLLGECGYRVDRIEDVEVKAEPQRRVKLRRGVDASHRGSNIFVLARPEGEPRWRYPSWLYASRHGLRRVVRPDVRVGFNDDVQAWGLHGLEEVGGHFIRWLGESPEATMLLEPQLEGAGVLRIDGLAPPLGAGGPFRLTAVVRGDRYAWSLEADGRPFTVRAALDLVPGRQEVRLAASPLWTPRGAGLGDDGRQLGVAIERVAFGPHEAGV